GSFRWFRDALAQADVLDARAHGFDVYDGLTAEAATAPAGAEGLLFLPYLTGERTPYPDPEARGVFLGLTLRHGRVHLIRAVLEGVAYGLRDSLELMRALGVTIEQVRVSGGGARSRLWRQILADVFESEIVVVNATEGAAFGAALLAGVGVGTFASVPEAADRTIRVVDRVTPSADRAIYADYYPVYRALYPALAPHFKQVGQLAVRHATGA